MNKILGVEIGHYQTVIAKIGTMGSLEHRRVLSCASYYPNTDNDFKRHAHHAFQAISEQRIKQLYLNSEYFEDSQDMWLFGTTACNVAASESDVKWLFKESDDDEEMAFLNKSILFFFKKIFIDLQMENSKVFLAFPGGISEHRRNEIENIIKKAGAIDVTSFHGASLSAHWIMNTNKINRVIVLDFGSKHTNFCIAPNTVNALSSGYYNSYDCGWFHFIEKLSETIKEEGYLVSEQKIVDFLFDKVSLQDDFLEMELGECSTLDGKFQMGGTVDVGEVLCEAGNTFVENLIDCLLETITNYARKRILKSEDRDIYFKRIFIIGGGAKIEGIADIVKEKISQQLDLPFGTVIVQGLGKINDFLPAMAALRYGESLV